MKAVVYKLEVDVDAQLIRLGLAREQIAQAITSGYLARTGCTPNHPSNYGGIAQYAETIRQLRDELVPTGWSAENDMNMEVTVSPAKGIAIAVVSGDENTGLDTRHPSTKRRRGAVTTRLVDENQQLQFDLPVPDLPPKLTDEGKEMRQTWILLHCFDRNELRFELSRPVKIGDDGYIEKWKERIIFPAIPIDGISLPKLPEYADHWRYCASSGHTELPTYSARTGRACGSLRRTLPQIRDHGD